MPFKTKRQKLSAAQHRYRFLNKASLNYSDSSQKPEDIKQDQSGESQEKRSEIKRTIDSNYLYVGNDLLKILILAGLIASFQAVLFVYLR